MDPERKAGGLWERIIVALVILSALIAVWLIFRRDHINANELARRPTQAPKNISLPPATISPFSSPNTAKRATIAARSQTGATTATRLVDKETMIRQLKSWIRKREGYEVHIVFTQDVLDLNGNPASLNVLVTTLANGELTVEKLKAGIKEANVKEQALREQLAKAKQVEDIAGVNRLVAELVECRTAFVTSIGVSSYKLSLLTDQPPVLAYWPGLPFEMVREEQARMLAETRLGGGVSLDNLVHFTSATALLRFANSAGASVLIDPFRMAIIPPNALRPVRRIRGQGGEDGRESRILSQWTDYLQP